tara:strand:- start:570 stop:797 length:228 start_codon:yes stop_codon:yes gene_type:complete
MAQSLRGTVDSQILTTDSLGLLPIITVMGPLELRQSLASAFLVYIHHHGITYLKASMRLPVVANGSIVATGFYRD